MVEDIDALRQFVRDDLDGLYPHVVLIEGNDPRLIDIGLLSKLPLDGVTSWQHVPDPLNPGQPIFSRDLLQVEILSRSRRERLFTVFNNHRKSHFVPFNAPDPEAERKRTDELRRRQCETVATIIAAETRPNSRFLVVGDMNDPPGSQFLEPLAAAPELKLVFGLAQPQETRPALAIRRRRHLPDGAFQADGRAPRLHPHGSGLAQSPRSPLSRPAPFIERRAKVSGDGSDHDPSWMTLEI